MLLKEEEEAKDTEGGDVCEGDDVREDGDVCMGEVGETSGMSDEEEWEREEREMRWEGEEKESSSWRERAI